MRPGTRAIEVPFGSLVWELGSAENGLIAISALPDATIAEERDSCFDLHRLVLLVVHLGLWDASAIVLLGYSDPAGREFVVMITVDSLELPVRFRTRHLAVLSELWRDRWALVLIVVFFLAAFAIAVIVGPLAEQVRWVELLLG
jgi:hypothetical protein